MSLSRQRIHQGDESPHLQEREAIAFAHDSLPDRDPFHSWPLQEFVDRSTGDLLEVDLIVLGTHALYVVEIKSYPPGAKLAGDVTDWRWYHPERGDWRYVPNPLKVTNRKAKVLKGLLGRDLAHVRVEALVFVSTKDLDASKLTRTGRNHVVFRKDFAQAIVDGDFPGARPGLTSRPIDRRTAKEIARQLEKAGVRASPGLQVFGSWELQGEIGQGPGWQEYFAFHQVLARNQPSGQARVRVYRRPELEDTREQRARLLRIAEREFQNLFQLRDCGHVLQAREFCENRTTHDPAIVFEAFDGGASFDSFLRQKPDLPFDTRLDVVAKVAQVLNACHRKQVVHRGLHPGCVLVRERRKSPEAAPELEVRVAGFQHAREADLATLQTLHATDLDTPDFLLYRAPELLTGENAGEPESDVFSLAAFAYFAFTGRPPASDPGELVRTIREQGGLRPGLVQDDLTLLDPVFLDATQAHAIKRPTPLEFVERLEDLLTIPDAERDLVDPREARPEDRLDGGFVVARVLGQGTSARVLEVERRNGDPAHVALKVPLDDSRAETLHAEAEVLAPLEHPGIVRLLDVVRPSGVTCLMLRLADPTTLAERLRQSGPLSLDLARRYGNDLLDALGYLESCGVTHRDIKPHNLGFTREVEKKQSRLVLFDFSLAASPPENVQLGTVAYRDPWLPDRERWDSAADRYSAAITLHEMLTGVRPDYGIGVHPAAVKDARPRLDPSRFDGSVREGVVAFFERALAARVEDRFGSADDMRWEWERIFREPLPARDGGPSAEPYTLGDDVGPDTPLAAFVHGPLLLDALARGGAETAIDVARLPRNRLSAVPGIGKETQQQILGLVTALRERFPDARSTAEPLVPGFRLAPEPLLGLTRDLLPQPALERLVEAGIRTTVDLARAAAERLDRILRPEGIKATRVRRNLEAYQDQADVAGAPPATLDGWLELFLEAGKLDAKRTKGDALQLTKTKRAGWAWLGLPTDDPAADAALGQREADPVTGFARTGRLAEVLGVSQPTVSNAIGKARDAWQAHPHKNAFVRLVRQALQGLGGAAALAHAAERLARTLDAAERAGTAATGLGGEEPPVRRAAALLRLATLLPDEEGVPALLLGEHHGVTWCTLDSMPLSAVAALGATADSLVAEDDGQRTRVPPFATARRALEEVAAQHLPEPLAPEVLLPLAARASTKAACSRKLELYPRNLSATEALNLARAAVQAAVPDDAGKALPIERLEALVLERYPEAAALPSRPALDALLDPLGLVWSDEHHGFVRRPTEPTAQPTLDRTKRPPSTTNLGARPFPSERQRNALAFQERLKLGVEKRTFRLIQCLDHEYEDAIDALARFLEVEPLSFDALLIDAMDALMKANRVAPELVLATDRAGPPERDGGTATLAPPRRVQVSSNDWKQLCRLAAHAAEQVLPAVTPGEAGPRLVVHLGLIARYGLEGFLDRWIRACEEGGGHAVFVVVPSEQGDDPTIDGRLPVPLTSLGAQRLWMEADWLTQQRTARGGEGDG